MASSGSYFRQFNASAHSFAEAVSDIFSDALAHACLPKYSKGFAAEVRIQSVHKALKIEIVTDGALVHGDEWVYLSIEHV